MELIMRVEMNRSGAPDFSTAEQIVICRNCRYREMKKTTFKGEPYIYYMCKLLEREVEDDEFCSWGDEK